MSASGSQGNWYDQVPSDLVNSYMSHPSNAHGSIPHNPGFDVSGGPASNTVNHQSGAPWPQNQSSYGQGGAYGGTGQAQTQPSAGGSFQQQSGGQSNYPGAPYGQGWNAYSQQSPFDASQQGIPQPLFPPSSAFQCPSCDLAQPKAKDSNLDKLLSKVDLNSSKVNAPTRNCGHNAWLGTGNSGEYIPVRFTGTCGATCPGQRSGLLRSEASSTLAQGNPNPTRIDVYPDGKGGESYELHYPEEEKRAPPGSYKVSTAQTISGHAQDLFNEVQPLGAKWD